MRRLLLGAAGAILIAAVAHAEVQLTIYNDDLALVKETRVLEYQRGVFELPFTDVAAAIDPTSVAFTTLENPAAVSLLEQNFRFDLVSAEKVLEKYLDRSIRVLTKQDKLHEGTLLAADNTTLTLRRSDGGLVILNRAEVDDLSFPTLPEGLITRPTLVWKLQSDVAGPLRSEVRYLTNRIGWHAEYIATVTADETGLDLAGWVSIDNRTGATYDDAKIKLMAGDVHRVTEKRRPEMETMMRAAMAAPAFEEKAFFEYHLYTLTRSVTLRDREIKQLSLFEPTRVKSEKVFTYDGAQDGTKIRVTMEFVNSQTTGLGIPLPKGRIRVLKADTDGSLEFVGEDEIDHTPRDEKVRTMLGYAFDIVGERTQTDHRQVSNRVYEEAFDVALRNHKKSAATIVVVEHFWGDWTILDSSHPYTKKDARTAEWKIAVPADGETHLLFTVRHQS